MSGSLQGAERSEPMDKRRTLAVVTALIGLFIFALGTVCAWKVLWQDLQAQLLKEQLSGIYRTGALEPGDINKGLLDLHDQNPDCICWLKIPDTVIDYPVMYRPDDKNFYLERDFNGEYAVHGSLFIDEDCDPERCDNLIIYGHHMHDGSMFAGLEEYKKEDFCKFHRYIWLDTLHGRETYEVMAAFAVPVYTGNDFEYYAFTEAQDEAEYDEFIDECKKRSYYRIGATAHYGQRLLTLSTCEYSHKNGRMVVVAVKTDGGIYEQ